MSEKIKVLLDPGHGGTDPGAVGKGGFEEKNIALSIAKEVDHLLDLAGFDSRMTRYDDSYLGLTQRCTIANRWPAALFVSIHLNADPDDDGPGTREAMGAEVWIYPAASRSRQLADCIAKEIKAAFPDEPFRGVKEGDLAVCRLTQMPAVLVEVAFIDNSESMRRLTDPSVRREMAGAIAMGISRCCKQFAAE